MGMCVRERYGKAAEKEQQRRGKPSVHSPGLEAARAMQVTRPNVTRSPGVRLYPKVCAALGLEAEHATPKHLGTQVPRQCGMPVCLGNGLRQEVR